LFATTLLCARKIMETIESDKPNMAEQFFIDRAIQKVESVIKDVYVGMPQCVTNHLGLVQLDGVMEVGRVLEEAFDDRLR
jgi:hypothetical protein